MFRLAPGSQTVPAFRSELVSVFHLALAPASHSESDLPVSRQELDPQQDLVFPDLPWKLQSHLTMLLFLPPVSQSLLPEQSFFLRSHSPFHSVWTVHLPVLSAFPAPFSPSPPHEPVPPNREAFQLPHRTLLLLCQIFSLKSYLLPSPLCCLSISYNQAIRITKLYRSCEVWPVFSKLNEKILSFFSIVPKFHVFSILYHR